MDAQRTEILRLQKLIRERDREIDSLLAVLQSALPLIGVVKLGRGEFERTEAVRDAIRNAYAVIKGDDPRRWRGRSLTQPTHT